MEDRITTRTTHILTILLLNRQSVEVKEHFEKYSRDLNECIYFLVINPSIGSSFSTLIKLIQAVPSVLLSHNCTYTLSVIFDSVRPLYLYLPTNVYGLPEHVSVCPMYENGL